MSTVFFNLRIDDALNERLARIAAEEGRSKNKQIEHILKEYVKKYESGCGSAAADRHIGVAPPVNQKKPLT